MEYLTDWVMGTSNQAADDDIKCLTRDLDQASMEAAVSLLAGLPLQPEEGDGVERGGADGVQVPALPQVTTTCFTHIPFI